MFSYENGFRMLDTNTHGKDGSKGGHFVICLVVCESIEKDFTSNQVSAAVWTRSVRRKSGSSVIKEVSQEVYRVYVV